MSLTPENTTQPARRWARYLPLALAALALAAFFATGLNERFTLAGLAERQADLRAFIDAEVWLAIALYAAVYAGLVAISFPGAGALTIFGGFLFAPVIGLPGAAATTVLAATIGAIAVYFIARTAVGDAWRERLSGPLARIRAGFDADALSYLFVLRLAPVFPFFVVNAAAGLLGVRLRPYVLSTVFGIAPGTFVYSSLGAGAADVIASGGELSVAGVMTQPSILLALAGLITLALIPPAIKIVRSRGGQPA